MRVVGHLKTHLTWLAQLVERTTFNRVATGSSPVPGIWRGMYTESCGTLYPTLFCSIPRVWDTLKTIPTDLVKRLSRPSYPWESTGSNPVVGIWRVRREVLYQILQHAQSECGSLKKPNCSFSVGGHHVRF
jgi:hypothetical protein